MNSTDGTSCESSLEAFSLGDDVYVGGGNERLGKIAFIGETQFAAGEWIGVILSTPNGKNDGSVGGVTYFNCQPSYGIFAKRQNLRRFTPCEKSSTHLGTTSDGDRELHAPPKASISPSPVLPASGGSRPETRQFQFQLGDRVQISGGRVGVLRFLGPTEFAAGEWAGIELDEPLGKNDGSVGGKRYFACKPNFGLFAAANKLMPAGSQVTARNSAAANNRRSQESLLSYCSNLSSVSRSYRAQYAPSVQNRTTTPTTRRPGSVANNSTQKEQLSNIQTLQRLIREKEEHISQLLEERDIERSDLAKATLEREQAELAVINQRHQIERLNQQLENMEAAHRILQEDHEQLLTRLHEERKKVDDLQFRMEEEKINKSTLESLNADDESKIFELEEALMLARETNEQTEAELSRVREELTALLARQETTRRDSKSTETSVQQLASSSQTEGIEHEELERSPCGTQLETKDAKVGSPRRMSLHQENLVALTSVAPSIHGPDVALQTELDRLHREIADREKIAENALKRQADVLELTKAEYEKQIMDLNAQITVASEELTKSQTDCEIAKSHLESTTASLQKDIEDLKKKLRDEEQKSSEKIVSYQNHIADLTAALEHEKSKTSEATVEHQLALHNLEEKLKLVESQLVDYQSSVLSSAAGCVQNQIDQVSSFTDPNVDSVSILSRLKEQDANLRSQLDQLEAARAERDAAIAAKLNSEDKQQQLEANLEVLRGELSDACKKHDELLKALATANGIRDRLVTELSALLDVLPVAGESSVEDLTQGLRRRMDQLSKHVADAEANRDQLMSRVQVLESERAELERELTLLKISSSVRENEPDIAAVSEQLEAAKTKMAQLEANAEAALHRLEGKSAELQAVQKQLDHTLNEHSQLKQSHEQAMAMMETERRQLLDRIQTIEANSAGFAGSEASVSNDELRRLIGEKTSAESQVSFLNSIIVDLHKKNAELEERVRSMLLVLDTPPV
ncbi:CAP-GLY domain-containing linker protein 1 [Clonorchis sinensis]|nr:CAP-GLY domain-containing linker protein 1 [Clonorchis sinensis]